MCIEKTKEKAKMFLLDPKKAFKKEQKSTLEDAFKYFLQISLIFSILSGVFLGGIVGSVVGFATTAVLFFVGSIIVAFIWGLILHVFAYIYGARRGVEQTLKAVLYACTPVMLLGWIPIVGWVFIIWTIVLEVIGLKSLQRISTGRALLAFFTPLVIIFVLLIIWIMLILMTFLASGILPLEGMGFFDPNYADFYTQLMST